MAYNKLFFVSWEELGYTWNFPEQVYWNLDICMAYKICNPSINVKLFSSVEGLGQTFEWVWNIFGRWDLSER